MADALVCLSVLFMDGYDTPAIGYVAPALVQAWHLDKAALAPVLAIGLAGLMIGGLFFGPFGRSLRTQALHCALHDAIRRLFSRHRLCRFPRAAMALRFRTGIGLGGAMPNAVALAVEYFPKRRRASAVTMVFVGFTVGAAIGGFAPAARLWLAGRLILVPLLLVLLPESLAFLILQKRPQAEILRPLQRLAPELDMTATTRSIVQEETGRGVPVKHLFTSVRAMPTALFWLLFFLALMITYLLREGADRLQ